MALIKRDNSKFWYVQFQLNHRTIVRSTRTTDRKIAEKVALKIRSEAQEEILLGRKKPITLETALQRFVDSKAGSPNHKNLVSHMKAVLTSMNGSLPLRAITPSALEEYCRQRARQGCLPQTIKHGVNCLMGALKKAKKDGFDCPELDPPSIKIANKMVRYLSVEEERRLLHELDPQRERSGLSPAIKRNPQKLQWMIDNHDLVIILLDTGARYSEIANIHWSQIDVNGKMIKLWRSKVQNESVLFMSDRVAQILQRRWEGRKAEHVFCNKEGNSRGYSVRAIRKALDRAGLQDCTIHTLRHTHASRLIQNGLNVYEVKAVLGHTDIRTTMRYAHLELAVVTAKARDAVNRLNGIE